MDGRFCASAPGQMNDSLDTMSTAAPLDDDSAFDGHTEGSVDSMVMAGVYDNVRDKEQEERGQDLMHKPCRHRSDVNAGFEACWASATTTICRRSIRSVFQGASTVNHETERGRGRLNGNLRMSDGGRAPAAVADASFTSDCFPLGSVEGHPRDLDVEKWCNCDERLGAAARGEDESEGSEVQQEDRPSTGCPSPGATEGSPGSEALQRTYPTTSRSHYDVQPGTETALFTETSQRQGSISYPAAYCSPPPYYSHAYRDPCGSRCYWLPDPRAPQPSLPSKPPFHSSAEALNKANRLLNATGLLPGKCCLCIGS